MARNQKFSIKTDEGKNILYADKDKILFAADKLEFLSNYHYLYFFWNAIISCDTVQKKLSVLNSFKYHKFLTVFSIDFVINRAKSFLSTSLEAWSPHGLCVCPGESSPGSSPGWGHCVVFLGKTLYFLSASLHPAV